MLQNKSWSHPSEGVCNDASMENNHNLFTNDPEEKECDDLSFVGWPTVEDADCMFRGFDSTYGCGELSNGDDFGWFTSQCIDGSDSVAHFNFLSVSPSNDENRLNSMMINNDNKQTKIDSALECKGVASPNVNEVSSFSNGFSPVDSALSFDAPAKSCDGNCQSPCYGYINNPEYMDATSFDPNSVSTEVYCSGVESQGDLDKARKSTLNLDSSNGGEASCISFELDVNSLEATRLCQLQQVMLQLDTRTKKSLRDGLYRLARSACQRHSSTSTNAIEGAKECDGLMDIETNTNPVDRSIAHLLFHRPTDPSANSNCAGFHF